MTSLIAGSVRIGSEGRTLNRACVLEHRRIGEIVQKRQIFALKRLHIGLVGVNHLDVGLRHKNVVAWDVDNEIRALRNADIHVDIAVVEDIELIESGA